MTKGYLEEVEVVTLGATREGVNEINDDDAEAGEVDEQKTEGKFRLRLTRVGFETEKWSAAPLNARLGNLDIERDFVTVAV